MFQPFKTLHKKALATDIVERCLKHSISLIGLKNVRLKNNANLLVRAVYKKSPDVFNGKRGEPPHDAIFAMRAFMNAVSETPEDALDFKLYMTCLEQMIQDIKINEVFYSLTKLDNKLLSEAELFLKEKDFTSQSFLVEKRTSVTSPVINPTISSFPKWEDWFETFKRAASEVNPEVLEVIPLDDPSIFKTWFKNEIDPSEIGRKYAIDQSLKT